MGRRFRTLLTLLGAVAAGEALAYPMPVDFDGSLMRWHIGPDNPQITYEVAGNGSDVSAYANAVADAAGLWNDVPTSYFRYVPAPPGEVAQVTVHLTSALAGATDAAGYTMFDQYDGRLPKHCSIFVLVDNGVAYRDLEKTFLHEFGHGLGLGHSLVAHAIMSYSLNKNEFALDIDDEAADARLYPADGSKPRLPPGCAVGTSGPGGAPLGLLALLAAPLLLALATVRSRCQL